MSRSAFAVLRGLAREDLIVDAVVNGRRLRMVASAVYEGEAPFIVWRDLLDVLRVGLLQRIRMGRILREKFRGELGSTSISGRSELTIPLALAAAMMASAPGMPAGLEIELERAVDAAMNAAGEKVLAVMPHEGRA